MDKRSLWTFSLMLGVFILFNTFILDTTPTPQKQTESILDLSASELPVTELKNRKGETLCSTLSFDDLLVTMSNEFLPETLSAGEEKVHQVLRNEDGFSIYSNKISPMLENATYLKDGDNFVVVTNLGSEDIKIFPATFQNGSSAFLYDTPDKDGLALSESETGLSLIGVWKNNESSISSLSKIEGMDQFISARHFSPQVSDEKFYMLENDNMQVVFSTLGGAIAELNLKTQSKEDPQSIIKSVALSKKIAKESPQNNLFPLHKTVVVDKEGREITAKPSEGGYTPLLRRDLINTDGSIEFKMPARNYGLALRQGSDERMTSFRVSRFTNDFIQFKGQIDGKDVVRSYQLIKDAPYTLEVKNSINGHIPSLVMSSGILEVEADSGIGASSLLYYNNNGKKNKLYSFKLPKEQNSVQDISPNWTATTNGFFTGLVNSKGQNPSSITTLKVSGKEARSRITIVDVDRALNPAASFPGYEILTPIDTTKVLSSFNFYGGPLDKHVLQTVDTALSSDGGNNPEFVKAITVRGWLTFISDPFSKFMNIILDFFYMITRSWGFSIILLTITLHLLLYPFSAKAFKSMIKMRKIAPKQKELEAKYKSDPQRMRMEMMMLYRNEGVNPLASILPMFLQIPFFIGMFDLLKTKFALRGATFIPGWIDNLTAPDVVFSWGVNIPFLGNEFHLLPILGALAMHFSQKLMTGQQQPKKKSTDMEKQMQAMGPLMTVVFLFIFYNLASGLNIYLLVSSLLRMLQQWYMNKKHGEGYAKISPVK